ncbi:MAG: AraC family transcriptional regulator ligand-binding domain-containing protein, partial [Oleiphilaceae bacterium]|nr:AraC family transcriptional regulator ligand-binding domain-containing protein [Oleiphilaceae bacterium]
VGHYGFGLEVGARIHPSDYGLMGYLLMNCRNLVEASQIAARFKNVINEGLSAQFTRHGDRVYYEIENRFGLPFLAPMIELDLASAFHFARLLVGPHKQHAIRFEKVEFQHQPLQAPANYEHFFGCPVHFGASRNCVQTSHEVVRNEVYGANPQLFALFESKLSRLEEKTYQPSTLSKRVFDYLQRHLGKATPDSSAVAERFHMSISAFKKHLQHEGTCFQQIHDEVRRQEACRLLLRGHMCHKEIAFQLGFASSSAFIRAFKRWLNMSPSEYRRKGMIEAKQTLVH